MRQIPDRVAPENMENLAMLPVKLRDAEEKLL
jgi:hypothetical protein